MRTPLEGRNILSMIIHQAQHLSLLNQKLLTASSKWIGNFQRRGLKSSGCFAPIGKFNSDFNGCKIKSTSSIISTPLLNTRRASAKFCVCLFKSFGRFECSSATNVKHSKYLKSTLERENVLRLKKLLKHERFDCRWGCNNYAGRFNRILELLERKLSYSVLIKK